LQAKHWHELPDQELIRILNWFREDCLRNSPGSSFQSLMPAYLNDCKPYDVVLTCGSSAIFWYLKEYKELFFMWIKSHWARNFVCFSPLDCCLCSPGLLYKAKIGFGFLLLCSFTSLFTPHRTLVNTHKIDKCAKFDSILLGVSREDDENIVSYRVSIKFWPSQVVILKFVNGLKTIKTC
jgi:hypothetical protein